jgi:hypothetical protein
MMAQSGAGGRSSLLISIPSGCRSHHIEGTIMAANVHTASVRLPGGGPREWVRWICTRNPFYVISAGLFLAGLWISFKDPAEDEETWALMTGLAGYTLLLAVTACLLVRFGHVWDDVRTVLLLVVLMFLTTSVTFDEVLVIDPFQGIICYLGGLLLAIGVSEAVLRGIRLRLPPLFRLPYYLILSLFFLYPLALRPVVDPNWPHSEATMWGLFLFSPVAGLVFLTLLPAIRRGPEYVENNGSPWHWPLYPWVLFGLLALAVPARAFLFCWSMHPVALVNLQDLIFGPYFLVPFGFAVAVLVLEIGLVSGRRDVLWFALAIPAGLIWLAVTGQRPDPIYQEFRVFFTRRLGADPLFLTVVGSAVFYVYAMCRRVPLAAEALTATLAGLAVVGPTTIDAREFLPPQFVPILLAALLQLGLGAWYRQSWRCLLGCGGLLAAAVVILADASLPILGLALFHLALLAILIIGAVFGDTLAHALRLVGCGLVMLAGMAALFVEPIPWLPEWVNLAYPLVMAGVLASYAKLLGYWPGLFFAALIPVCWLLVAGARGYLILRQLIKGLDYLAISLALFALAVLISLGKSALRVRRLQSRQAKVPDSTG